MIIRTINPNELPVLLELYCYLHPDDAPVPPQPELDSLWQTILTSPWLYYFVADIEGQLVASCTMSIIPNLTRGARPYALIENMVTHPAYRRQGIGRALLRHAVQVAQDNHCYKVMLLTSSKESAVLRFYEQAGFNQHDKIGFVVKLN